MALPIRVWRVLERLIRMWLAKARVSLRALLVILQRLLGARRSVSNFASKAHQPGQLTAKPFLAASIDPCSTTSVQGPHAVSSGVGHITGSTGPQGSLSSSSQVIQLAHASQPAAPGFDVAQGPTNGPNTPPSNPAQRATCSSRAKTVHTHWSSHPPHGLAMKSDSCPSDWVTPLEQLEPDPCVVIDDIKVDPFIATLVDRYGRKSMRDRGQKTSRYMIQPVTLDFQDQNDQLEACANAGWTRVVHPEGAVYWFYPKKRVFTDAPLWKRRYLQAAMLTIEKIQEMARPYVNQLPGNAELVLELRGAGAECRCGIGSQKKHRHYKFEAEYYFVSHENRRLFWLQAYDAKEAFARVEGVTQMSHIGLALEHEYWQHCEWFPYRRPVSKHIICEAKEVIHHYMSELVTSDTSLTPFNTEELMQIRESVQYTDEVVGEVFDHSICILSRVMRTLTRNRFFHFHGQPNARLNSDQVLFQKYGKESALFKFFMICLFNAPRPHLKRLRAVWIDKVVNQVPWRKFIDGLNTEWRGYTLYSTVLLTVNLSLLALFNVMPQNDLANGKHPQTVAEVMSYVSTACSVGSVLTSLILVRQNETKSRESIDEAVRYLETVSENSTKYGIEMLAIIYSLPFGFLLWGILFFSMAFLALAFQETLLATRIGTAVAAAITVGLILWPVFIARDIVTLEWWLELARIRSPNRKSASKSGPPTTQTASLTSPASPHNRASSPGSAPPSGATPPGTANAAPPAAAQTTVTGPAPLPNGAAASPTATSIPSESFFGRLYGEWKQWNETRHRRQDKRERRRKPQRPARQPGIPLLPMNTQAPSSSV